MSRLVVEQGKDSGAELLVIDAVTVGRDLSCGLVLHDRQISRQHCRFEASGEKLKVVDLGSRNGILVNGVRTREADLKIGDRVAVGTSVLRVAEGDLGAWSGKTVGGYRFADKIGEGGMGEVYRAEQLSMNRYIAAKVLSAKLSEDPRYVERLLKEARAAAQLNHPALIQVHDVLQTPEITFFSMELVQGKTMREELRKGPFTVTRTLAVAKQVAEALKYAHAKGIVHHDVKPENVMLAEDGRVKLADLGIAQPSGAKLPENAAGRRTLLGTPQYMPPDQITGDRVDPRFDLYALGATCYHALGGRPPYRGGSPEEIVKQLASTPPAPLGSLAPGLPPDVVRFIEKMMARDPAERHQTADQVLKDIAALQAKYGDPDQTVSSPTGTGPVATPPSAHTGGVPKAALAAAGVLVLAAVAWAVRNAVAPPAPPPPPPPPKPAPPNRAVLADALLARARKSLAAGDREGAVSAYREYLRDYPDQPGFASTRQAVQDLESERREREAEKAWALVDPASLSEDARIERLRRFADAHPGTERAKAARDQAFQLEEARSRRLEEAARNLSVRALEAAQQAKAQAESFRFSQGMGILKGFLEKNPGLPPEKARDLQRALGEIQSQRDRFWTDRMKEFQLALEQRQFPAALKVLAVLQGMEEGWAGQVAVARSTLDGAVREHLKAARRASDEALLAFQADQAEKTLEGLERDLEGYPEKAQASAWRERARELCEAHRQVLGQIEKRQPKPFPIETPLGRGSVVGLANDGSLEVRLADGSRTARGWKTLANSECLDLYKHYLDERLAGTHYTLFCFSWSRGMRDEAAREAKMAKPILEERPGMLKAFEAEAAR